MENRLSLLKFQGIKQLGGIMFSHLGQVLPD